MISEEEFREAARRRYMTVQVELIRARYQEALLIAELEFLKSHAALLVRVSEWMEKAKNEQPQELAEIAAFLSDSSDPHKVQP